MGSYVHWVSEKSIAWRLCHQSRGCQMYDTTQFRKGLKIEYEGKPWVMVDFQHVNPGKGAAFVRTKLKNMQTGQVLEVTFKSGDRVGVPDIDRKEMQYLYNDGEGFVFMDNVDYEQVRLSQDDLGEAKDYLIENMNVNVTFYQGKPVDVEIENFVNLRVTETQPNIKGDTSSGGGKPATLETGLTITVPFHINEGDLLRVDTRSAKYIEKVKE